MWTTDDILRTADPGGEFGTSVDDSQQSEDRTQGESSRPVWTTHSQTEDGGSRGGFGTSVDDSQSD